MGVELGEALDLCVAVGASVGLAVLDGEAEGGTLPEASAETGAVAEARALCVRCAVSVALEDAGAEGVEEALAAPGGEGVAVGEGGSVEVGAMLGVGGAVGAAVAEAKCGEGLAVAESTLVLLAVPPRSVTVPSGVSVRSAETVPPRAAEGDALPLMLASIVASDEALGAALVVGAAEAGAE